MTDFEKNSPLGIVTEGLLQKQDPIAAAAGGVIQKKKYTWIAKVDAFLTVSSILQVSMSHNGDMDTTTVVGSDVEITYNPQTDVVPLEADSTALYEFIPSTVVEEERGGRGAHTIRRKKVQPHIFIWDVPLKYSDAVSVSVSADVEFIKAERFSFIKSLPKTTTFFPVEIPEQKPILNTYEYTGKVGLQVDAYSRTKHIDYAATLRKEEEDLLALMLSDAYSNDLIVTTMYDVAGDIKRNEEELVLRLLNLV